VEKSMTAKKWLDRGVYLCSMLLSKWINQDKDPKLLTFNSILCVKEDEIGDFVYTLPVYSMLRKQFPNSKITVLCRPFGVHLLSQNKEVDVVTADYSLLESHYDLLIDLRGTPASTKLALSKSPMYRLDRGTQRYQNRKAGNHPHEAETNWSIVKTVIEEKYKNLNPKIYLSEENKKQAMDFLNTANITRFAIFHTGARRILKKWPLERVITVMNWLHSEHQLDCVLAGDALDANDASEIQSQLDFTLHVAAGKLNLLGFAALCEKASLFLGNDSGPLHIAAAMGTPSLGLYGPGDPIFHPRASNAAFLHHILECNPCDQVHCKYKENPCIQRISVDEVKEKIGELWGEFIEK